MVIVDYLVATSQDDIHATIKPTRYCVVHLTLPVHIQLESHTRLVAMTRDQMEQLRFRGRFRCLAWDATCPNTFICASQQQKAGSAATAAELKKAESSQVPGH